MRRVGGLALSREHETKEARQELARRQGRVHITANDTGPGRPVVGGGEQHRRIVRRYDHNIFATFQCSEDLRQSWLRSAANDKGVSVRKKLAVLRMMPHRVGQAIKRLSQRYFALKRRR